MLSFLSVWSCRPSGLHGKACVSFHLFPSCAISFHLVTPLPIPSTSVFMLPSNHCCLTCLLSLVLMIDPAVLILCSLISPGLLEWSTSFWSSFPPYLFSCTAPNISLALCFQILAAFFHFSLSVSKIHICIKRRGWTII